MGLGSLLMPVRSAFNILMPPFLHHVCSVNCVELQVENARKYPTLAFPLFLYPSPKTHDQIFHLIALQTNKVKDKECLYPQRRTHSDMVAASSFSTFQAPESPRSPGGSKSQIESSLCSLLPCNSIALIQFLTQWFLARYRQLVSSLRGKRCGFDSVLMNYFCWLGAIFSYHHPQVHSQCGRHTVLLPTSTVTNFAAEHATLHWTPRVMVLRGPRAQARATH